MSEVRKAIWWANPPGLPPFWMCPWPIGAVFFAGVGVLMGFRGEWWAVGGFVAATVMAICAYGMEIAFRMMATNCHDLLSLVRDGDVV